MALHDSLSSGPKVHKLSKMSSVPTTEDLRYALAEAKKLNKPVELPFENNRNLFTIKVTLQSNAAPRWTFSRGEGPQAKIIWNRDTTEVMMIQNKIKVESAYDGSASGQQQAYSGSTSGYQGQAQDYGAVEENWQDQGDYSQSYAQQPQSGPIVLGTGGGGPGIPTTQPNWAPAAQQEKKMLLPPKPLPLSGFGTTEYSTAWPQSAQPQSAAEPGGASSLASNLDAVRAFARSTYQEVVAPAVAASNNVPPGAPAAPATAPGGAPAAVSQQQEKPSVNISLPPPVAFDNNLINGTLNKLSDPRTGLMSFEALVYFLHREFVRFQTNGTGLAIVLCEVALIMGDRISTLPAEALPVVAPRIRSMCSPLDVAAHINGGEFAILTEYTDEASLLRFTEGLYTAIKSPPPLMQGLDQNSTVVAVGAASIPNTCAEPGVLVAAAEMAKEMAKGMKNSFLLFPARSDMP